MELCDILNKYESEKKFEFYNISSDLNHLIECDQESLALKAESLAMAFSEGGYDDWGSFYGPTTTWTIKSTGELVCMPDKKEITPEIIGYWTERISETQNSLLKMRYSGLVWDFCKIVTGKEPDFRNVKLVFIRSAYDVVKNDNVGHCIIGLSYMNVAIEKAISLKQKDLVRDGMQLLMDYVQCHTDDSKPGIWSLPLKLICEHYLALSSFEKDIVKENEERFERLYAKCKNKGNVTDSYAHVLIDEATLLADYYRITKDSDEILSHLDKALSGVRYSFALRGAMWSQTMLQQMQDLFRKYGFDKRANQLYIDIEKIGKKVFSEMTPTEYSIPIDRKALDEYLDNMIDGTINEVLNNYAIEYMPKIKVEIERQREESERAPLLDLVHTVIYDWSGMPISHIGSGANAEKNKLAYGVYRRMLFNAFFMQIHIRKMEEKEIYTYENLLAKFKDSYLIADEQRAQFEKGIKAYFDADYLVACHLLVPMFESAIRKLAALSGIEVLSSNKDGGNEYKTFEVLLGKLRENKNIPEDIFAYFQNLFTDKFGWNVRNLICHGLLQSDAFNKTLGDRIIHAFLTLSLIKIKPINM